MSNADPEDRSSSLRKQLTESGVRLVAGWATNGSNLVHAKTMPVERVEDFVSTGAGISPVYNGYSVDATIQFTGYFSAVGDLRLRLDPAGVRVLGDGLALGPTDAFTQAGQPDPCCPRVILKRLEAEAADLGLSALIGHELEFVLVAPDGSRLASPSWTPYGLPAVLDLELFLLDLIESTEAVGVRVEQLHAEYGPHQLELSLPPASPVQAADTVLLTKAVIGRTARRHGMAASFSPVPFAGSVGSGAHQHLSLTRNGAPLFADGDGPHGMTAEGGHALGGLLAGLTQAQAVLTGCVLSGTRLAPGLWSGASICWGTENREASLRFLQAGAGNPHGANVEVKIIDPSANPYLASATILGLALEGVRRLVPLPREVTDDPSAMTEADRKAAGIELLPQDQSVMLDALERSELMRRILGEQAQAALLSVRRHEHEVYAAMDPDERCEALRLAWTL